MSRQEVRKIIIGILIGHCHLRAEHVLLEFEVLSRLRTLDHPGPEEENIRGDLWAMPPSFREGFLARDAFIKRKDIRCVRHAR